LRFEAEEEAGEALCAASSPDRERPFTQEAGWLVKA
jgi:hypothetical protein